MKEIFCTCIIPTVGRDSLSRAVESVLSQSLPEGDVELIVINDSGRPLPRQTWQTSNRVRVVNTNRRERSVARNTGAAMARGQYLHFLDDDDWIAENAYLYLWDLSQRSGAVWLYGMTQIITRQLKPTHVLQHAMTGNQFLAAMAGEWIPLQTSLIERKAFLRAGGFNPILAGPEDIDLLRRVMLEGEMAETPHLTAYVILGEEGSTTDYDRHPSQSRQARESILDSPCAFRRMQATAVNPYWQARMLRIYLTSTLWNLQNQRLFTALNRLVHALAALVKSRLNIFRRQFWSSLLTPYASPTFTRGILQQKDPGDNE